MIKRTYTKMTEYLSNFIIVIECRTNNEILNPSKDQRQYT